MDDLAFESVTALADKLARKQISSRELTALYLKRIERLNPKLHAYCDVYPDEALAAADKADAARSKGDDPSPLAGLPIAVKDLCDMAGKRGAAGSATWSDRIAPADCTVVEKLKAAGMVILGRTHMVEFAFGTWGTNPKLGAPWNPWDLTIHRVPGGSSSGSGVAVAAGLAPCAIGSDTGGSVRIPAALNGITGLKTTSGLISIAGVIPLAATLDTIGPMTRTADDAAILTALLAGKDARDAKTAVCRTPNYDAALGAAPDLRGLTVVTLPETDVAPQCDAETLTVWRHAAETLRRLGASIVERRLPVDFDTLTKLNFELTAAECFQNYGKAAADASKPFGDGVRARVLTGGKFQGEIYREAIAAHEKAAADFAAWIDPDEAVLTPTVPFPAIPVADVREDFSPMAHFTRAGNFLRASSLSLPAGFAANGMPIGIMLTAGPWREDLLIRMGRAWQAVTDWHARRPNGV